MKKNIENQFISKIAKKIGINVTCKIFDKNYSTIYYHQHKNSDSNNWGGKRYEKYDKKTFIKICAIIWDSISKNPCTNRKKLLAEVKKYEILSSEYIIIKALKYLKLSYKRGSTINVLKYTEDNIKYYTTFLKYIYSNHPKNLKFMDECYFVDKETFQKMGYATKGKALIVPRHIKLESPLSVILFLNLEKPFITYTITRSTINENDFIIFIELLIKEKFLVSGNSLIYDNARCHNSATVKEEIKKWEEEYHINFINTPKYSPEVNPCENIFGFIKNDFRKNRNINLEDAIYEIIKKISEETIKNFYKHCFK